jgi:hypothetical protein
MPASGHALHLQQERHLAVRLVQWKVSNGVACLLIVQQIQIVLFVQAAQQQYNSTAGQTAYGGVSPEQDLLYD